MTPQTQHSSGPGVAQSLPTRGALALALPPGEGASDSNTGSRSGVLSETARRRDAYELLALARKTVSDTRTAYCMHAFRSGELGVVQRGDGRAGYRGFIRCGSRWRCPVCSRRAAALDYQRSLRVFRASLDAGHCLFRVTYTMRHSATIPLARSIEVMRRAQQLVHSGRRWQRIKERYSLGERSYGAEMTHGDNGWHVHRHSVYEGLQPPALATKAQRKAYAATLGRELEAAWLAALEKIAPGMVGAIGIAVKAHVVAGDGEDAEATSRYLTKYAMETTQRVAKFGRKGSRTPWQLLRDGWDQEKSRSARTFARERFREYSTATHGLHGVWMSRGWSRMAPEPTQGELTADDPGVLVLPLDDQDGWVLRYLKAQVELLERVERFGPAPARAWLDGLRYQCKGGAKRFSPAVDPDGRNGKERAIIAVMPSSEGRLVDWEWGSGPAPGPVPARRHGRARAAPPPEDEVDDF